MQSRWRFLSGSVFSRVFDRKCSQHGDRVYLALLRSRWVRLVGRRCCDSIGTIKAICERLTTPHWLWVYSGLQHMYSPQSVEGERVLPAGKVLPTPRMCHLSQIGRPLLLFHPCEHSVTMETGLLPCISTNLKFCSLHSVKQSPVMTCIFWKPFLCLQQLFTWAQHSFFTWF